MNGMMRPRGRLPARVYWFRRALVLGAAALLVFGIAQLFGGGGSGGAPSARLASAPRTTTPPQPAVQGPVALSTRPTDERSGDDGAGKSEKHESSAKAEQTPDLPAPSGPCDPADLSAKASLAKAAAGGDVPIDLELTGTSPACTFKVSPSSLVVKLTSGKDRIWSTQDCPRAVPRKKVVVRAAQPAEVTVTWGGHRSTPQRCGGPNPWARPGYYHVHAAVMGSVPSDRQFRLTLPSRPVITKTAHPDPKHKKGDRADDEGTVKGKQSACGGDNAC